MVMEKIEIISADRPADDDWESWKQLVRRSYRDYRPGYVGEVRDDTFRYCGACRKLVGCESLCPWCLYVRDVSKEIV